MQLKKEIPNEGITRYIHHRLLSSRIILLINIHKIFFLFDKNYYTYIISYT